MGEEHNSTGTADARANRIPWPPILLLLGIAGAMILGRMAPMAWPGLDDGPAHAIGLGLGLAGLALAIWAVMTLRRHDTTVMPHGRSDALVTSGPYARFRNPIYLGEALMFLGLAELSKNIWFALAAALFAVLVTALQIVPEERHLEARFGETYRDYKSRTRRWI
jgi:protein-S-isoprenylcysteine O-methyltransferase Ste14